MPDWHTQLLCADDQGFPKVFLDHDGMATRLFGECSDEPRRMRYHNHLGTPGRSRNKARESTEQMRMQAGLRLVQHRLVLAAG